MCGRVTLTLDKADIEAILGETFGVTGIANLPEVPAYNIAPSDQVLSIVGTEGGNRAGAVTWGFVPHWTKEADIRHTLINARGETVTDKPAFKEAFMQRRCLILADYFIEWKREDIKRPYAFSVMGAKIMALAGIYNVYYKKDGSKLSSCAVLTCEPNSLMAKVHNRMPVILDPAKAVSWLDSRTKIDIVKNLLAPYEAQKMSMYEVSTYINSSRNKGAACLEPASPRPEQMRFDL